MNRQPDQPVLVMLATLQHIADRGLGSPLTIHKPIAGSPCVNVVLDSTITGQLDAWSDAELSGFEVASSERRPSSVQGYDHVCMHGVLHTCLGDVEVRISCIVAAAPRLEVVRDVTRVTA